MQSPPTKIGVLAVTNLLYRSKPKKMAYRPMCGWNNLAAPYFWRIIMALAIAANKDSNKSFEKSDRALNFNFPVERVVDGELKTVNVKLAVGWLKASDKDQAMLIEFLDAAPENMSLLFQAMADASTYINLTEKAEAKSSLPFALKRTA